MVNAPGAERDVRATVRRRITPRSDLGADGQGRLRRGRRDRAAQASGSRCACRPSYASPGMSRVPYRAAVPLTRRAIFARDGGRCVYCCAPATSIDHVMPRSRGGMHVWENVVSCCRRCNHTKADRIITELGWRIAARPCGADRHRLAGARLRTHGSAVACLSRRPGLRRRRASLGLTGESPARS